MNAALCEDSTQTTLVDQGTAHQKTVPLRPVRDDRTLEELKRLLDAERRRRVMAEARIRRLEAKLAHRTRPRWHRLFRRAL